MTNFTIYKTDGSSFCVDYVLSTEQGDIQMRTTDRFDFAATLGSKFIMGVRRLDDCWELEWDSPLASGGIHALARELYHGAVAAGHTPVLSKSFESTFFWGGSEETFDTFDVLSPDFPDRYPLERDYCVLESGFITVETPYFDLALLKREAITTRRLSVTSLYDLSDTLSPVIYQTCHPLFSSPDHRIVEDTYKLILELFRKIGFPQIQH